MVVKLAMHRDISSAYGEFLSGKKLKISQRFYDLSTPAIVDRIEYLRQRSRGKKVLHLGCLDHAAVIARKIEGGTWLHGIISREASECVGIDIDRTAYELVKDKYGVDNVRLLDLCQLLAVQHLSGLRNTQWDLILCAEMLEHITNHELFLENIRTLAHDHTKLIVTVPNAFYFANFINALRGFESINTDHKYWFTFYTLSRLLSAAGWKPRQLVYYNHNHTEQKRWRSLSRLVSSRVSRMFASGLIVEATVV